jgi:hypothetical protein
VGGYPSSGIFSLAFRDRDHGVVVGDYKRPEESGGYVALSSNRGRTWTLAKGAQPGGYRSGVSLVPGTSGSTRIAVGPTGTDVSVDDGENWRRLGATGLDPGAFAGPHMAGRWVRTGESPSLRASGPGVGEGRGTRAGPTAPTRA